MDVVTGGAGFIGSHLVDALVAAGRDVRVLDDLSSGHRRHVPEGIRLDIGDCADAAVVDAIVAGADTVWHLAADPEVRTSGDEPVAHADRHLRPTLAVLEAMRRHDVAHLSFTSTSTVYGRAEERPTPESYGPLLPISIYGGAKLACEALVAAYCGRYGLRAQMFRFANVVGPRATHGVTVDFVHKLMASPHRLEILGDGSQTKSYVHVSDTVAGMVAAHEAAPAGCTVWNIGSLDAIPVTRIAEVVAEEMGLRPELVFTEGAADGAGWAGDVKHMGLAVDRLLGTGWSPAHGSEQAIRSTARWLVEAVRGRASTT